MRRFNYTGRRKIPESDVQVELLQGDGSRLAFRMHLNLKSVLPLRTDSRVIVEAYDGPLFERFEAGPATELVAFSGELESFTARQSPLFRIKIVEASDPKGRIAAHARSIRATLPGEDGSARSLLHVTARRLGELVYKIEFPEEGHDYPTLVVNEAIAQPDDIGAKALARHPIFVSVVMPQAVRDVLTRLLLIEEVDPDPNEDSWRGKWIAFAERLAGSPSPDYADPAIARDWIETVVEAFARRIQALERFKQVIAP